MAYSGQATIANAQYLARKTGLDPAVALAWLRNEGQAVANPTNPLNIIYTGTHGQTGKTGRFGHYSSTQAGLDHVAWLILNSPSYSGIRKAIQTGNPVAQAQAIQNSPWAGGHYGHHAIVGALPRAQKALGQKGNTIAYLPSTGTVKPKSLTTPKVVEKALSIPTAVYNGIVKRATAVGKTPTTQNVVATYLKSQGTPTTSGIPTVNYNAILARAKAAGKNPTAANVVATYYNDLAKQAAKK